LTPQGTKASNNGKTGDCRYASHKQLHLMKANSVDARIFYQNTTDC